MLVQLHHQFKDGHTEMKAQNDIVTNEQMGSWFKEIRGRHPLPDNAQWLVCTDESEHFVKAVYPVGECC